ncbi:MAG: hypothetical protein R3E31_16205 [Chloroflexota bacterium]
MARGCCAHLLPAADWAALLLALVLLGIGLALLRQDGLAVGLLLWSEVVSFNHAWLAAAMFTLLAAYGLADSLRWGQRQLAQRGLQPTRPWPDVVLLLGVPLLLVQGVGLWQQYQMRATGYQQLLAAAGDWVDEVLPPETAVFAPPAAAYAADRPLYPWNGQQPASWSALFAPLLAAPPAVIISGHTLPWDMLIHSGWFQDRYQAEQTFASASVAQSPVTVWTTRHDPFAAQAPQPIRVAAANGMRLVGYQYTPAAIQPGEALYVTLYWEATRALTANFNTIVRLISPLDQVGWAQRNLRTPRSLPPAWIAPGMVFPERFVLTTTTDIPIGAYQLNVSLVTGRDEAFTPLYQNDDSNPLDRVLLGYVSVPWLGQMGETAVSVHATFADQITLQGYQLTGALQAGTPLTLTLYWDAMRPLDANYTVFVHLLDANGQDITGHDSPPRNGTYPTQGWLPGYTIADEHSLFLPSDLPAGEYRLAVGLYVPETGVRLPAFTAAGVEQPNQTLILQTFQVPEQVPLPQRKMLC